MVIEFRSLGKDPNLERAQEPQLSSLTANILVSRGIQCGVACVSLQFYLAGACLGGSCGVDRESIFAWWAHFFMQ